MRFLFRPPPPRRPACCRCRGTSRSSEWDPARAAGGAAAGHLAARRAVRRQRGHGSTRSRRSTSGWPARSTRSSREFQAEGLPTVSVLGICVDRARRPGGDPGHPLPRVLDVLPAGCSPARGATHSAGQLLDTLVELLVRLHLAGMFWGDCSLSNTLFRPTPGRWPPTWSTPRPSSGTRRCRQGSAPTTSTWPASASERSCWTSSSAGCCPTDIDPIEMADSLPPRYEALWDEVTHEEVFGVGGAAIPGGRAAAAAQRPRLRRR